MKTKLLLIALALAATSAAGQARAQSYPTRPITAVVGFAPGGGTDTVSRIVAKTLGEQVGQQVLTDNKAGAGGNIATDHVIRSAPDGYTIYLANVGAIAVNPHLLQLAYDPLKDLAPITMAVVFPNLVVIHPRVPANSLAEFIQLAKKEPGKYTYGSSGIGGAGHLAGELLKMMAGIDITHVPFKGGGPAMQAMIGGQIDSYMATPVAAGPHVKSGKVKALATTGAKRDPFMAEVPTVSEVCCAGYQATNWYAYYAPAKTPKEILARLNKELVKALQSDEVKALFAKQGLEAAPGTPEQLAAFGKSEYETWGKVVKQAGIKAQ
jgi:tripartite-type tricarboxylate transporter receptor subunit TctC